MGPVDAPARLGSSDTCVLLSPSGHSVPGDLSEGGHTSRSSSWGGWGNSAIEAAIPSPLSALGSGTRVSAWHAGGGGESGRFTARGTHIYLQGGGTEVKLGFLLAGDSGALAQVLGSVCILARAGDSFLKCISVFASLLITATERQRLTAASSIRRKVLREQKGEKPLNLRTAKEAFLPWP